MGVAFGPSAELLDGMALELFEIIALGQIAPIRAALDEFGSLAAVVALSAVGAEFPTAGMAAYSASKAALSAYLAALRHGGAAMGCEDCSLPAAGARKMKRHRSGAS